MQWRSVSSAALIIIVASCSSNGSLPKVTRDGGIVEGGTIEGGELWHKGEYSLSNPLTIKFGALEVDACSVIRMPVGGTITVSNGGSLRLKGTKNCPITITSSQSTPLKGDWHRIEFHSEADHAGTSIDYAVIEYGGGGDQGAIVLAAGSSISMTNSTVRYSLNHGLQLTNGGAFTTFTGNTLVDNDKGPIILGANSATTLGEGVYSPNGTEGIQIRNDTVDHDGAWLSHDAPYVTDATGFTVKTTSAGGSAHLTLNAGVTLKMGLGAAITIADAGALAMEGTAQSPVVITSASSTPAPGDWRWIKINGASSGSFNRFGYATISYGGSGDNGQVWLSDSATLNINNVTFQNTGDKNACDIATISKNYSFTNQGDSVYNLCARDLVPAVMQDFSFSNSEWVCDPSLCCGTCSPYDPRLFDTPDHQWGRSDWTIGSCRFTMSNEVTDLSYPDPDDTVDGVTDALLLTVNASNGTTYCGEISYLPAGLGYGYYEIRLKPGGESGNGRNGCCTTFFWIQYDENVHYGGDSIELKFYSTEPWSTKGWLHYSIFSSATEFYSTAHYPLDFDPSLKFHRYGFLWTPDYISYTIDGVVTKTFSAPKSVIPRTTGVLLISAGSGDPTWCGIAPLTTNTSAIDWIRYYRDIDFIPSN